MLLKRHVTQVSWFSSSSSKYKILCYRSIEMFVLENINEIAYFLFTTFLSMYPRNYFIRFLGSIFSLVRETQKSEIVRQRRWIAKKNGKILVTWNGSESNDDKYLRASMSTRSFHRDRCCRAPRCRQTHICTTMGGVIYRTITRKHRCVANAIQFRLSGTNTVIYTSNVEFYQ